MSTPAAIVEARLFELIDQRVVDRFDLLDDDVSAEVMVEFTNGDLLHIDDLTPATWGDWDWAA